MAADQLYRIVYLSRAVRAFDSTELRLIAASASAMNDMVGLTGLLLYDGSRFLQALEGPKTAAAATMDGIERDGRHDSIAYIQDTLATERQFSNWGMQFKLAPNGCCSTDFLEKVKADVTLVDDPHLRAAFIGFAVLSSQRARGYVCSSS